MVSKALVVGAYQRKAEEIARQGVELTVLVPPSWRDRRGQQSTEQRHTCGYQLRSIPLRFNGNYHLHYYPTLAKELRRLRPQVVHMDEEPYNLATWLGVRAARSVGAASTFFTWQNLYRRYPLPFRWMEQATYRRCPIAIAGNAEAAAVLRRKGYAGQISILPQFGIDPAVFSPKGETPAQRRPFHIGYAGGLLPEKGVDLLLRASADLPGQWQVSMVGSGNQATNLARLSKELGIAERVHVGERLASEQMPDFYRSLDVLVLPSRTRPNWKEQFGRVLIEAMACGVAVIGSDSGEIPNVIGEAGLIFPEEDVDALRRCLQLLLADEAARKRLAAAGRRRALTHFTMRRIAQETVGIYEELWKRS